MDWDDPQAQTVMVIRHEAHPSHNVSSDGGKTWTAVTMPSYSPGIGVVDAKTIIAMSNNGIWRSEDLGKTWAQVSKEPVSTRVMRKFKSVCYAIGPKGLLVSADKSKTWAIQGEPILDGATAGPIFGKDENHILVAGKTAIQETADGGKTWKAACPSLPPELDTSAGQCPFSYDPKGDIFYVTCVRHKPWPPSADLYRYER